MNPYQHKYMDLLKDVAEIHPETKLGLNVRIGRGVIIEAGCEIGANCLIGHYTVLRPGTVIGNNTVLAHHVVCEGETSIGNRATIQSQSHLTKGMIIEEDVFIAHGVFFANTNQIKHGRKIKLTLAGPTVCRGARVGVRAVVMPGVTIGEESLIGACALVTRDTEPYWVYLGQPARKHRRVPAEEWLIPPREESAA